MAEYMYRKGVKIDPHSYRAHINWIVYLSEHGKYKIPLSTARALSGDDRINLCYYTYLCQLYLTFPHLCRIFSLFEIESCAIQKLCNYFVIHSTPKNVKRQNTKKKKVIRIRFEVIRSWVSLR